jgi:hypothetical protein
MGFLWGEWVVGIQRTIPAMNHHESSWYDPGEDAQMRQPVYDGHASRNLVMSQMSIQVQPK